MVRPSPIREEVTPVAMSFIILIVLVGLMYAFLILPQQRKVKKHRELVNSLEVGDDVLTSSGIYGTVVGIDHDDDQVLEIEVADGLVLRMARGAVAEVAVEADIDMDASDDSDDGGIEHEGPIS